MLLDIVATYAEGQNQRVVNHAAALPGAVLLRAFTEPWQLDEVYGKYVDAALLCVCDACCSRRCWLVSQVSRVRLAFWQLLDVSVSICFHEPTPNGRLLSWPVLSLTEGASRFPASDQIFNMMSLLREFLYFLLFGQLLLRQRELEDGWGVL